MKLLTKGERVVIVSPSEATKDDAESKKLASNGIRLLESLKLEVSYGRFSKRKVGSKSGTPEERASDLEEVFSDTSIKAIFCSQGGDNSNELLPLLDWNLIKKNPKFFFGMSDITVLLNAIYTKTGMVTYHGTDLMWGLGKNATEYSIQNLKKLLFDGERVFNKNPEYPAWITHKQGFGTGICIGGCLPSFCLLLGTKYDPIATIKKPFILLMESIGESPARIESHVTQLTQQPNFAKYCAGVIIGNFFMCSDPEGIDTRNINDVIIEQFKEYDFPIIEIKELGHAVENILFPIGEKISIKGDVDVTEILQTK